MVSTIMRYATSFIFTFALSVMAAGSYGADIVPSGQRQLFLDDYCIAEMHGLQKTMHQPEKRGAVILPDQPRERWVQTRSAPAWDEQQHLFKMWVNVSSPDGAGSTCVESKDGIHWIRSVLRQRTLRGSRENNFLEFAFAPELSWPNNCMEQAVYDPNDRDPNRRYKGFLSATSRQPIASPDGIHWKRLEAPAILSGDEGNLSYDPVTRTFIATFKTGGPHGRSHAIWTSKDFVK
jgi:hypothetical protein